MSWEGERGRLYKDVQANGLFECASNRRLEFCEQGHVVGVLVYLMCVGVCRMCKYIYVCVWLWL